MIGWAYRVQRLAHGAAKRLGLLRELVPSAARVAVLVNPSDPVRTASNLRDVEAAARAIGVDPWAVKLGAITLSGGFMGAGGAFYVQVFQYIDPAIASPNL